ncbi:class I SAM-dependent methyltransferase [Austwickia chelonae]|uniref:Putative methyltransferase n=1 Tax=Austwickia chelonae NBRC 105200 TaxID=1184607 RepID=K6VPD2_9MICO|nr:class I SAM-dependent methyltransferase [Austwickia chelonae]GAB77230.1 putative methyltransferase [Austwickia chelonae NBRC 105200]
MTTGSLQDHGSPTHDAGYRAAGQAESVTGNRRWWDAEATDYYQEHGAFLGDRELVWGPEGLRESDARLLGEVRGQDVLEIGCGAAQGARWVTTAGGRVVATDLSQGMLAQARKIDTGNDSPRPVYVQCDACALPFADETFDIAFSAYGAVPFVADSAKLMQEVARVLRPGGRWIFSVTHPLRWSFPDAPGPAGLTVHRSYFDRTPYVERVGTEVTYAEHHRTLADRVGELLQAGFVLTGLSEPEWPEGHETTWGGWSPLRGRLIPGTLILTAERPRTSEQSKVDVAGQAPSPAN